MTALAYPSTAFAAYLHMGEARSLAKKVGKKIATINDADDWELRGCARQDSAHIFCTIAYYGFDSGGYDCRDVLTMYAKGDGYTRSRLNRTTC